MRSTVMNSVIAVAWVGVAALTLAGCGSGSSAAAPATAPATAAAPATTAAAPARALATGSTSLGTVVIDGTGLTAYYFDYDKPHSGVSACKGPCLQAWPPITTMSVTPTVTGVTGTVATIPDPAGGNQITIDGRPIYTFAQDAKPGDVNGQGVQGVWHVVSPAGKEIKAKP